MNHNHHASGNKRIMNRMMIKKQKSGCSLTIPPGSVPLSHFSSIFHQGLLSPGPFTLSWFISIVISHHHTKDSMKSKTQQKQRCNNSLLLLHCLVNWWQFLATKGLNSILLQHMTQAQWNLDQPVIQFPRAQPWSVTSLLSTLSTFVLKDPLYRHGRWVFLFSTLLCAMHGMNEKARSW